MTAKILDGNKIAGVIKQEISERIKYLDHPIALGTLLVGSDVGSQKYVEMKHRDCAEVGIKSIPISLPEDASQDEVFAAIDSLNADPECTGFIVQLPLPKHIDQNAALERMLPSKDADGLHPANLGKLVLNVDKPIYSPLPCTPLGIIELMRRYDIELEGKSAAIIGRGVTAGRPLALLMSRKDVNATVINLHSKTKDLAQYTRAADIVIAAIGQPHFLKSDMISKNAIVIDVGVSRGGDGKIQGDADPECASKASFITPNPGGIGPMTRVMLLKNVTDLASF